MHRLRQQIAAQRGFVATSFVIALLLGLLLIPVATYFVRAQERMPAGTAFATVDFFLWITALSLRFQNTHSQ